MAPANWPQDLEQVAARFADEGAGVAEPSVALERQVFFAYSRQDQDFALRLAAELKRRGVPLWVDQWEILPGEDWNLAIDDAVYECGHFMIVLSPAAVRSREVRGELQIALNEGKPIVSVLYQSCRIPRQLQLLQYVDYTARGLDEEAALARILQALGRDIQRSELTPEEMVAEGAPIEARAFEEPVQDAMPTETSVVEDLPAGESPVTLGDQRIDPSPIADEKALVQEPRTELTVHGVTPQRRLKPPSPARTGSVGQRRRRSTPGQRPPGLTLVSSVLLRIPAWAWGLLGLVLVVGLGLGLLVGPKLWGPGETPTPTPTFGPTSEPTVQAIATRNSTAGPTSGPTVATTANSNPTATPTRTPTATPTRTSTPDSIDYPPTTATLGDTWPRPGDDMVMVYVPAGEFLMGSTDEQVDEALQVCNELEGDCNREWFEDEQPAHTVSLDAFWIDRTEVTNAQFAAFLNDQGNQVEEVTWLHLGDKDCRIEQVGEEFQPEDGYAEHPVIEVSWYGAAAYCAWAGGRLPTEAEWEYAARGPEGFKYPWGNSWGSSRCNSADGGIGGTAAVGSYPDGASWCGALDLAGNVWEWVADCHGRDYYASSPRENPEGPTSGDSRMLRGGSWFYRGRYVRSATRYSHGPLSTTSYVGFRCVLPAR